MKRMKKRVLSVLLALSMVLTFVPTAFAAGTAEETGSGIVSQVSSAGERFAGGSDSSGGGLTLAATEGDTIVSDDDAVPMNDDSQPSDGIAITGTLNEDTGTVTEDGLEESGERTSGTEAANEPATDDQVTFVVELEQSSLLDAGYSADEIADDTSAVRSYEEGQKTALEELKAQILETVGDSAPVEFGYTYTVASTGLSVTTTYENKAKIAEIPGVKRIYVSPKFHIPETDDQLYPQTSNATVMIGADQLNETGYTGKGMRIAIIDTGLMLTNPSFGPLADDQLTEDSMTKDEVIKIWDEGELNACEGSTVVPGNIYYSTKVPYIYNYALKNTDVSHDGAGSDHGTHVAGIAAANKLDSTDVVGVAPEAQLLVMQVFSGNGADWNVVMAAMEDCVRLGADVANLSLGSAAGYCDDDANMNGILKKLLDAGVQVVIAAGNDTNNAYNNNFGGYSLASNPDVGLVGTPSTYYAALSVASANNNAVTQYYFTVNGKDIGYNDTGAGSGNGLYESLSGKELEFVVLSGYGDEASYVDENGSTIDVEGKVVVVSRGGGVAFPDKQANAQERGAVACVVYNNTTGVINMQINTGSTNIPCVSITQSDGLYLKAQAEQGNTTLTVSAEGPEKFITATAMSDFSSWGSTSNLKLKPEITGVGGNIYSTRDPDYAGDNYGYMSGTSMASPQVAGAMAVLNQYLRQLGYEKGESTWKLATNLLMSTANPIMYSEDLEYSPRQQGAGLVDLVGATEAGAYLSNPDAAYGRPKAEVGDSSNGTYVFNFIITNISDEAKTYTFDSSLITETYDNGLIGNRPYGLEAEAKVLAPGDFKYDFNDDNLITTADARLLMLSIQGDEDAIPETDKRYLYRDVNGDGQVDMDDVNIMVRYCADRDVDMNMLDTISGQPMGTVTVEPRESVMLLAEITLTDSDKEYLAQFPNGMFVEGYLYAESTTGDAAQNLTMPILGFYGDWSAAPVFDGVDGTTSLYDSAVYTYLSQLGTNPYIRASQRSGDAYNAFSYVNPLNEIDFGLLRNAKLLRFTVTDVETGEEYFQFDSDYNVKTYYSDNYGMVVPFYIYNATADEQVVWTGLDQDGDMLTDGTRVRYTVDAYLDDGDNEVDDTWSFEATLDTQAPKIQNAEDLDSALKVDEANGIVTLTLDLYDSQNIAAVIFLSREGEIMGKFEPGADYTPGEPYEQAFNITGFGTDFTIIVGDYACNETELEVSLESETGLTNPKVQPLDSGRLYGSENIDISSVEQGWFSVEKDDLSDARNETFSTATYFSGEYVNGRIIAQRNDGDIVLLTPYGTYWESQMLLESSAEAEGQAGFNTLYDMALLYDADGPDRLFAVGWTYDGNTTPAGQYSGSANLYELKFYENGYIDLLKTPITGLEEGDEIVTLAISDDGIFYGIDTEGVLRTIDPNTGACTRIREITEFTGLAGYAGVNVVQSMCYDHEEDVIYWAAHSQSSNGYAYSHLCEVLTIDPSQPDCPAEVIGSMGHSGASALFVPTELESDLFELDVDPSNFTVSPYETYLLEGKSAYLDVAWNPWNAKAQEITWESSNPDVVTVNSRGRITAVVPGTASITATAQVYGSHSDESTNWEYVTEWYEVTQTCSITVVPSQEHMYGYVVTDETNASNQLKWITYSDTSPRSITHLGDSIVTVDGVETKAMWQGGTYCNGVLYTVQYESRTIDDVIYQGTAVYRSEVTLDENGVVTGIGAPEEFSFTDGIEVGNISFDYTTGRMYGVDLTHGGLCVIDMDTGAIDSLGEFQFESSTSSSESVMTAMCVICQDGDAIILTASMNGNLYIVNPDTMVCTNVGTAGAEFWFYGSMLYDYNTGNIYWNPSAGGTNNPLYLVVLTGLEYGLDQVRANIYDIGDVASSGGVEQTVMFTIPEEGKEPETNFIPVEDMWLTGGDTRTALVGGFIQLTAETNPARPTVQAKTWTSSDPTVASVDNFGKVTCLREGETTITVTLTDRDRRQYSDTVDVTVLASGGNLTALLAYDSATGYRDFWVTIPDYAPAQTVVGTRVADLYNIRAGEYYDGYFYAYEYDGTFIRVSASAPMDYTVLGSWNLPLLGDKVVDMAFDYKTGTMYALTSSVETFYDSTNGYSGTPKYSDLMTVNLQTGELTKVATVDAMVNTLAIDGEGTIYAVGSEGAESLANVYKLTVSGDAAHCESVGTVAASVRAYQYGKVTSGYGPQMTYDFATNRLYLKAAGEQNWDGSTDDGLFMIQLDENGEVDSTASLGKIGLFINGASTVADAYLGLLCAIPDAADLPESGYITGVLLNTHAAQMLSGQCMTLTAQVQPSGAAHTLSWSSDKPEVATVDEGVVTAVGAGTATITVTAADNTGRSYTDSCTLTVVESVEDTDAYAITDEGLVIFNPEAPSTYTTVMDINSPGNVVGMDVDVENKVIYYVRNEGGSAMLYRRSLNGGQENFLGALGAYVTSFCDMAYDSETQTVYLASGLYVFQYYVPNLSTSGDNQPSGAVMPYEEDMVSEGSVYGVTVADGRVIALCNNWGENYLYQIDNFNTGECTFLGFIDGLNIVPSSTEFAYDPASGTYYATSARSELYAFTAEDLYMMREEQDEDAARIIGSVGGGLDITGLTIAESPTAEQLQQWSAAYELTQAGTDEKVETESSGDEKAEAESSSLTPSEPVIVEELGEDTAD